MILSFQSLQRSNAKKRDNFSLKNYNFLNKNISKFNNNSKPTFNLNNNTNFNFSNISIQPKLKVSQPDDPLEREADIVAEQIMRMSSSSYDKNKQNLDKNSILKNYNNNVQISRKCTKCEKEEKEEENKKIFRKEKCSSCNLKTKYTENEKLRINRKSFYGKNLQIYDKIGNKINNTGSGNPLDHPTRKFMESRFGFDFSDVRIHQDIGSADSAESLNALAYTINNDIFFGKGQYKPWSKEGNYLLAHELVHVIQQSARPNSSWIYRKKYTTKNIDAPCPPEYYECKQPTVQPQSTKRFKFLVSSDDFAPGEEDELIKFIDNYYFTNYILPDWIDIYGMASSDGPFELNKALACYRAMAVVRTLEGAPFHTYGEHPGKGLRLLDKVRNIVACGPIPNTENDPNYRSALIHFYPPERKIKEEKPSTPPCDRKFIEFRIRPKGGLTGAFVISGGQSDFELEAVGRQGVVPGARVTISFAGVGVGEGVKAASSISIDLGSDWIRFTTVKSTSISDFEGSGEIVSGGIGAGGYGGGCSFIVFNNVDTMFPGIADCSAPSGFQADITGLVGKWKITDSQFCKK